MPNARIIGANKIDAALYEGPSQLITAIEEDFGIPINNYVELNFDTFANVVNALGGVKMYFPIPIFDAESGLNIERAGCYDLDGYHALQVVRARHLQIQPDPSNHDPRSWPYEALSDIARIRRTHEFLRVLAAKVAARGLGNPLTDQSILTAVLPSLTVDSWIRRRQDGRVSPRPSLTPTSPTCPSSPTPSRMSKPVRCSTRVTTTATWSFPSSPMASAPSTPSLASRRGRTPLAAPPCRRLRASRSVSKTVPASQVKLPALPAPLSADGFDVLSTGTVTPNGPVSETVVWYGGTPPPAQGNWTSPNLAAAEAVLSQLQGPAVLGYDPSEVTPGATVTIQTGTASSVTPNNVCHHHDTLGKVTASTTTTTGALSTTTTTGDYTPPGMRNNADFTTPSAVDPTLEPWDPRACNAAGTGPATTP